MSTKNSKDYLLVRTMDTFLDNMNDWFFAKNSDLIYVCSSKSFAVFMGYSDASDIVGKTDTDLFGEELAQRYNADDRKLMSSGVALVDYIEPVPDINNRKRYSSSSKHLIKDDNGNIIGLYGTGKDITLQIEFENAAKTAKADKSDFFARISHDMRTPMNGILGLVNLALDEETSDSVREKLKSISASGRYLLELINDTIDLSKMDLKKASVVKEEVNGEEFCNSVLACLSAKLLEKKIDIVFKPSIDLIGTVCIDRVKMQQVFVNLLSNSIKFTPAGGKVELELVKADNADESYYEKVIVRDNGIGMGTDFLPKIFEPFEQENVVEDVQAGSGLGMSIVLKLVKLMDGKIEVKSEKNAGTEITVSMRINQLHESVNEKKPSQSTNLLENLNILLCEDNKINQQIAVSLLQKVGCIVAVADNGEIGLELFKASPDGHFFAILMDIRMPTMNGLQATSAIRALDRRDALSVPIIAMSANSFEEDVQSALSAGIDVHFAKPIDTELLFKTLCDFKKGIH